MVKMFIESLKNLTQKPATIGYPHTPSPSPKDYRGTIYYQEDLCIFCDLCEEVCPPGAILFEIKNFEENIREYSYNPYLCIYCHACVDVCPKAEEGCLVQAESRLSPLGRDSTLPKDVKLGYFMSKVETAKHLDGQWDVFEERCEEARDGYDAFKAERKRKKKEEAEAKKKAATEIKETVAKTIEKEALVKQKISKETELNVQEEPAKTNAITNSKETEPTLLKTPKNGKKDNLAHIKGIGIKIEELLNDKGIFHYEQIAAWTEENIQWINTHLSFSGRVQREEWIAQAKQLAAGEKTDFSKKVDGGEVPSSKKS